MLYLSRYLMEEGHFINFIVPSKDGVWMGARVLIINGSRIGKGSVIGAGSLVNKDIPPYSIAVGNPVRVIDSRYKK